MKLHFTLSLLAFAAVARVSGSGGLDDFWTKYGSVKIMRNCFNDSSINIWHRNVQKALTHCNAKYETRSLFVRSVEEADWSAILEEHSLVHSRQRRSPIFTAEKIKRIKEKLSRKIEIFRCVMQEMGVIDAENAVSVEKVMAKYRTLNLSKSLLEEVEERINKCHAFTECIPLDGRKDLPVPADVIKTRAFLECSRFLRFWNCLKNDVKRKVAEGYFDFKGLDGSLNSLKSDEDRGVAILMAEEMVGPDDFDLYE